MNRGDLNAAWGRAMVEELARGGLAHACVAPGSRSTPLVLALAEEDRVRVHVHLDERSAAFFALGVGKATGRPAAVVTTSGTGVANLFPAVVEAARSQTPLILLTADRPPRLRGTDANQTVDQVGMFGPHVRLFHDVGSPSGEGRDLRYVRVLAARALSASLGSPAGPVHLNFPFEKPLEPSRPAVGGPRDGSGKGPATRVGPVRPRPSGPVLEDLADRMARASRGLVVAGPSPLPWRDGPAALSLARTAGWPLLADPLSGARFGEGAEGTAVPAYDLFLRSPEVRDRLSPDLVIRLGGHPTSAVLGDSLAAWSGAHQVTVSAAVEWPDPDAVARGHLRADPAETARALARRVAGSGGEEGDGSSGWREAWREVGRRALTAVRRELEDDFFEGTVLAEVSRRVPAGGTLFVASSMPVRDLDSFGEPRDADLLVLGNRGASGIDGSVSVALGAAVAREGPLCAVLGDLALYHDMNGLLAAREEGVDAVLVVIHNDGGGIFHMLPVREHEPAFTPYFATPHGLDFRHAAELYGLEYRRARDRRELRRELESGREAGGVRLVEVPSDRESNRLRHEDVEEAVRRAVTG